MRPILNSCIFMLFPVSVIMTCRVFLIRRLNYLGIGTLQPAEDSLICNQHTNEKSAALT